jgi:hypothetical protein
MGIAYALFFLFNFFHNKKKVLVQVPDGDCLGLFLYLIFSQ